jgi:hypothetical protein
MANKTMKFYGIGYAPTGQTASITATYNGETVFSGTIPTVATTQPTPNPTAYEVLFTHEVAGNLIATVPMSVTSTSGNGFTLARVEVNSVANVAEFAYMSTLSQGDCRTNVEIDGTLQDKGPLADVLTGPWSWNVPEAGTITYTLDILDPFAGNVTP